MSKYGHRTGNWFEAVVNKLGGEKAAEEFLSGKKVVVDATPNNQFLSAIEELLPPTLAIVLTKTTMPAHLDRTMLVNLDTAPSRPFFGAKVFSHTGGGWVLVEKSEDGPFVNRKKVILLPSQRRIGGETVKGFEICEEITGEPVYNTNLLDALIHNPQFIPEEWKRSVRGKTYPIFSWGTVYNDDQGKLFVRCVFRCRVEWRSTYRWLIDET